MDNVLRTATDKVARWKGMTQTHGFLIDVFRDPAAEGFVAQIRTYSPPLWQEYFGGKPSQMVNDKPEELRHQELHQLRELTKQHIISRCGKILEFTEN